MTAVLAAIYSAHQRNKKRNYSDGAIGISAAAWISFTTDLKQRVFKHFKTAMERIDKGG
jgi:hypothetical protein